MKQLMKRTVGIFVCVVGLSGVVLSVCMIAGVWLTADRLERELPLAIGQLESIADSIDRRAAMAIEVLRTSRARIASIVDTVEDLAHDPPDRSVNPLLNRIDAEVVDRLERAEDFLLSMQGSLEGAGRAASLLESIPFLQPRGNSPSSRDADNATSLASSLAEVARRLEQLTRILRDIRSSRTVNAADLALLRNVLAALDEQLVRIQADVEGFTVETTGILTRLAEAKRRSRRWISRVAVICTIFLVCFGVSQLNLSVQAWRSWRGAPDVASGAATDLTRK